MGQHRAPINAGVVAVLGCISLLMAGCDRAVRFQLEMAQGRAARMPATASRSAKKPPPLPKSGDVLIAGGTSAGFKSTNAAEFFDPNTNKFTLTRPMGTARAGATGTSFVGATGTRALVAGGATETLKFKKHVGTVSAKVLNTAELYDPATGTFSPPSANGTMVTSRVAATSALLPNGQVLIAGGIDQSGAILNTAEIFDPTTGDFSATGNNMTDPRGFASSTLLDDGTVLIAGGVKASDGTGSNTADIFNPGTGTFSPTSGAMNAAAAARSATKLNNGTVLIAGGATNLGGLISAVNSAEVYDPTSQTFTSVPSLNVARALHSSSLLPDGTVLIAGGQTGFYNMPASNEVTFAQGKALDSAEIYDPLAQTFNCLGGSNCPRVMKNARMAHQATTLADGTVLLTGGIGGVKATQLQKPLNSAEEYDFAAKTFKKVGSMKKAHAFHVAALLKSVP